MRKKGEDMATKKKRFVIVRSHTAGVHFGELVSVKKDCVTLKNSRRLWKWSGASLSQVASEGPASGENKFGIPVTQTDLISPQGFEIAYCSSVATEKIKSIPD